MTSFYPAEMTVIPQLTAEFLCLTCAFVASITGSAKRFAGFVRSEGRGCLSRLIGKKRMLHGKEHYEMAARLLPTRHASIDSSPQDDDYINIH